MKINRLILFFTLIIGFVNTHSQNYIPYYNLVNEAEYQMILGKNDLALGLYNKAFSIKGISPKAKDVYFVGKLYLAKRDIEKATIYFKKIFHLPDGQFSIWALKEKAYFLNYYTENEFLTLLQDAEGKENDYILKVKFIQDSLNVFHYEDQRLRKTFVDSIQPRYNEGDKIYDLFCEKLDSNDYENQLRFLSFIKKHGYPGTYLLGSDGAATILRHIHCKLFMDYRQTLYELLIKGKMEPFYYAEMVDLGGSRCGGKAEYNDNVVCQICPEYRTSKRLSIGLSKYFKDPGTRPYIQREPYEVFE